jgi:hypothetical protein
MQLSTQTGAAAFTLGGGEMNYCQLKVVSNHTNRWQRSPNPTTNSSWVATQQVSCIFNCCHFFSHEATNEYQILFLTG